MVCANRSATGGERTACGVKGEYYCSISGGGRVLKAGRRYPAALGLATAIPSGMRIGCNNRKADETELRPIVTQTPAVIEGPEPAPAPSPAPSAASAPEYPAGRRSGKTITRRRCRRVWRANPGRPLRRALLAGGLTRATPALSPVCPYPASRGRRPPQAPPQSRARTEAPPASSRIPAER